MPINAFIHPDSCIKDNFCNSIVISDTRYNAIQEEYNSPK